MRDIHDIRDMQDIQAIHGAYVSLCGVYVVPMRGKKAPAFGAALADAMRKK